MALFHRSYFGGSSALACLGRHSCQTFRSAEAGLFTAMCHTSCHFTHMHAPLYAGAVSSRSNGILSALCYLPQKVDSVATETDSQNVTVRTHRRRVTRKHRAATEKCLPKAPLPSNRASNGGHIFCHRVKANSTKANVSRNMGYRDIRLRLSGNNMVCLQPKRVRKGSRVQQGVPRKVLRVSTDGPACSSARLLTGGAAR